MGMECMGLLLKRVCCKKGNYARPGCRGRKNIRVRLLLQCFKKSGGMLAIPLVAAFKNVVA